LIIDGLAMREKAKSRISAKVEAVACPSEDSLILVVILKRGLMSDY